MTAVKSRSVSGVDQDADAMVDILRRLKNVEQLGHRHPGPVNPGFKNAIINPTGRIRQSPGYTIPTGGGFNKGGPDLWRTYRDGTGGSISFDGGEFAPGNNLTFGGVDISSYCIVNQSVAPTGQSIIYVNPPYVEDVRIFEGQLCTFSFWALPGTAPIGLAVFGQQYFGTGGAPSAAVNTPVLGTTIQTGVWTRVTNTFIMPPIAGKTLGTNNDHGFFPFIQLGAGIVNAVNYIYIVGCQLELGSTPTRFEYRPPQVELAMVQRHHYRKAQPLAGISGALAPAQAYATIAALAIVPLPVTMRRTPTLTTSAAATLGVLNAGGAVVALNALPTMAGQSDSSSASINLSTAGGLVAGNAAFLYTNAAAGYLDFDATLI